MLSDPKGSRVLEVTEGRQGSIRSFVFRVALFFFGRLRFRQGAVALSLVGTCARSIQFSKNQGAGRSSLELSGFSLTTAITLAHFGPRRSSRGALQGKFTSLPHSRHSCQLPAVSAKRSA